VNGAGVGDDEDWRGAFGEAALRRVQQGDV